MNSFDDQQKNISIKRIGETLREITPPRRNEEQWIDLENRIISKLNNDDRRGEKVITKFRVPFWYPLAAAAAILIVALTPFKSFLPSSTPSPVSLTILSSSEDAVLISETESKKISDNETLSVGKNKSYTLKTTDSPLTVRLDDGSGFLLKESSILSVIRSDETTFLADLKQGEILASVTKRENGRQFVILSHNAKSCVVGTIFGVSVETGDMPRTTLSVHRGAVQFSTKEYSSISKTVGRGSSISCTDNRLGAIEPLTEANTPIRDISYLSTALEVTGDSTDVAGMIEFISTPKGAKVSIGGAIVGTTPLVSKYPAGNYTTRLSMDGYITETDTIRIQPGGIKTVVTNLRQNAPLKPQKASKTKIAHVNRPKKTSQEDKKLMPPEYVEALIQITVGEYRKALEALETLRDDPSLNRQQKLQVMEKITHCYRGLGDFNNAVNRLEAQYQSARTRGKKGSLLWQIATMRLNCLGDFEGAQKNLQQYIAEHPHGSWSEQALLSLAELAYLQEDASKAIELYKRHTQRFESSRETDRSLFRIGRIYIEEFNQPRKALGYYERIIEQSPNSRYFENSLYELHRLYKHLGLTQKAKNLHEKYIASLMPGQWSAISSKYE